MRVTSHLVRVGNWAATATQRLRRRFVLTASGLWMLGIALLAWVVAVTTSVGVAEDVTMHNGLANSDASNLDVFTRHRSDFLVHASRIVTESGATAVLAVVAVIAGFLLWRRGLPLAAAAAPALSLAVAAIVVEVTKRAVDRSRPPVTTRLTAETEPSFPSGHAANSAALYLTLGLVVAVFVFRRPLIRVAIVVGMGVLVAAIGASRLMLGVHWPTDVLAGWSLGATVALGVTIAATLIPRFMSSDPPPPKGRLRRAGLRMCHVLALERAPASHGNHLRAA